MVFTSNALTIPRKVKASNFGEAENDIEAFMIVKETVVNSVHPLNILVNAVQLVEFI